MMSTLVLSPHADDEVLGCASLLSSSCHVLYFGIDNFHVVSRERRLEEVQSVAGYFGFTWEHSDFTVNRYYEHIADLIHVIEKAIAEHRPDTVLAPVPSYNQDHRAVYKAFLAATRHHDRNHMVRRLFLYEEPDNFLAPNYPFNPSYFVPLDLEWKISANRLHSSQQRGHRSPEILTTMAKTRGLQAGLDTAEGFEVRRWVER